MNENISSSSLIGGQGEYDRSCLVGDFHEEGGDPLGRVVVVRDVVYHLDDVNHPHEALLHLVGILEVDGVARLLNGPEELGVVCRLNVVLGYAPVNVVPDLWRTTVTSVLCIWSCHSQILTRGEFTQLHTLYNSTMYAVYTFNIFD